MWIVNHVDVFESGCVFWLLIMLFDAERLRFENEVEVMNVLQAWMN